MAETRIEQRYNEILKAYGVLFDDDMMRSRLIIDLMQEREAPAAPTPTAEYCRCSEPKIVGTCEFGGMLGMVSHEKDEDCIKWRPVKCLTCGKPVGEKP